MRFLLHIILCSFILNHINTQDNQPKIVALVPGHNDNRFLTNCFKSLALFVDAIVYLDDASTDSSIDTAITLQKECRIEQIMVKKEWIRDASRDRNILLQIGRSIGGTHFVVIDADEMFTSNLLCDNILRNIILNLKPGERLALAWIQLWRSVDRYRYDSSVWTNNYMTAAFCDDGVCSYSPRKLCESRTPDTLTGKTWFIEGYVYGLMHFQFVNFENLLRKQAWYRCQEHVLNKDRSFESINLEYCPSKDERDLRTLQAPKEWFNYYNEFIDLSMLNQKETWREQEVMKWFSTYGIQAFAGLDIWDTGWPFEEYIAGQSSFIETFLFPNASSPLYFKEIGKGDDKFNPANNIMHSKKFQKVENADQKVSLLFLHETTGVDVARFESHVLCIKNNLLTDALQQQLSKNKFIAIPYNDNGYTHYIRITHH